jgi:hypothetical protein
MVLAIGLILLLAAAAAAGTSDKLTIKFDPEGGFFSGAVKSNKAECLPDRKITMYKRRKGPDKPGRSTTTQPDGGWGIARDRVQTGATYYVRTPKLVVSSSLTCPALRSKDLTTPG